MLIVEDPKMTVKRRNATFTSKVFLVNQ